MEWNVKNALNRDVEREQLNKILKEIRQAVDATSAITQSDIRRMVEDAVRNAASPSIRSFTITLTGDATGSGTSSNLSNVTIPVTIDTSDLVEASPADSNIYWRAAGAWEAVPYIITALGNIEGQGFVRYTEDYGWTALTTEETDTLLHTSTYVAAEPITELRAVAVADGEAYVPLIATSTDGSCIVGISRSAADTTEEVEVQTGGLITNEGWSWAQGAVYADDEGVLTQTPPTTGWLVRVGTAVSETTIDINVEHREFSNLPVGVPVFLHGGIPRYITPTPDIALPAYLHDGSRSDLPLVTT